MTNIVDATEARKQYQREYRKKNRDKINAYRRDWNQKNPDRLKEYNRRYWERVAAKQRADPAAASEHGRQNK